MHSHQIGTERGQFTLTGVGRAWTQVGFTHNVIHKGRKIQLTATVKISGRKAAVRGAGWINSPA